MPIRYSSEYFAKLLPYTDIFILSTKLQKLTTLYFGKFLGIRYKSLGCWKNEGDNGPISSLEERSPILDGKYNSRGRPILKCAEASYSFGYGVFALQQSGKCLSSENAANSYNKYGTTGGCYAVDGQYGSKFPNQVYKIVNGKIYM